MIVTPKDLEQSLERLRRVVVDPEAGIHGPGSKSWEVNREGILFLGGGRAALLQLAHPFVAHGVDDHSSTRSDPQGRFVRTFENVWAMEFGNLDHAFDSARRVHAIHTRVRGTIDEDVGSFERGTPYCACDADALLWVYATLLDSAVQAFELTVRHLARAEKEQYYQESKLFAYLFGVPEELLPEDWDGFASYMDKMLASDVITVGRPAASIARFVLRSPHMVLTPLANWYKAVTAGLLPPRLRQQFGLRFGLVERTLFEGSMPALKQFLRALPAQLRYLPVYRRALERLKEPRLAAA